MSRTGAPQYLYGIIRAGALQGASAPRGIDRLPVDEIPAGPVAALCSSLPSLEIEVTRDRLASHLRLLHEVGERTTVLPMRFGTVVADETAVRDHVLAPRVRALVGLLGKLDGMVEVDVKASFREDAILTEIVREQPSIRRLDARIRAMPGDASYYDRVRLGELVVAAMNEKAEREGRTILSRLAPAAARAKAGPVTGERGVLNAAFLVDRSHVDAFERAVAGIEEEQRARIRIRSIGPLPPSSFASLEDAGDGRRRSWKGR